MIDSEDNVNNIRKARHVEVFGGNYPKASMVLRDAYPRQPREVPRGNCREFSSICSRLHKSPFDSGRPVRPVASFLGSPESDPHCVVINVAHRERSAVA